MFGNTCHKRKMIILASSIIAGRPPRTDVAMRNGFGIRLRRRFRIDYRGKTRLHESVVRKKVMQPERFRLKGAARADDVCEIRHAPLNLPDELRVQTQLQDRT